MNSKEILQGTRELLSDPSRWTKGLTARTTTGLSAVYSDKDADSFCLWGALYRAGLVDNDSPDAGRETDAAEKALDRAVKRLFPPFPDIVTFNDDPRTTHEQVIDLIDRTIAETETA